MTERDRGYKLVFELEFPGEAQAEEAAGRLQDIVNGLGPLVGASYVRQEILPANIPRFLFLTPDYQDRLDAPLSELLLTKEGDDLPVGRMRKGILDTYQAMGVAGVRAAVAMGFESLLDEPGFGKKRVELIRNELKTYVPGIPFAGRPSPDEVARFCPSLEEVPVTALNGWDMRDNRSWGSYTLAPIFGGDTSVTSVLKELEHSPPSDRVANIDPSERSDLTSRLRYYRTQFEKATTRMSHS